MDLGGTHIIQDKQGRYIIIIIPDAWPSLPIEAFFNGVTVGKVVFKEKDSTVYLTELYINENFRSSGIAKELIRATINDSISYKISPELASNLSLLGFFEHCINEKLISKSVLEYK